MPWATRWPIATSASTEARALIETAHKLAPEDPFILDSLGWVLYPLGRNQEALGYLQRAYRSCDRMPRSPPTSAKCCGCSVARPKRRRCGRKRCASSPKNDVLQGTVKRFAPAILQSAQ